MNVAIIPARGGSKRIPRKNIKEFFGKPIIAYSIQAAKRAALFNEIYVSTDDAEIANVASEYGARVIERPAPLADDYVGTNEVVKHGINVLKNDEGKENIEYVCCIYATAPFIDEQYLRQGFYQLINSQMSYSLSVTSFPFPIMRSVRINSEGKLDAIFPEYRLTRSQDLEEAYHDAGQFLWGKAKAFLDDEIVFSPVTVPVVMPRNLVQDIDTPEDWACAELMYKSTKVDIGRS